MHTCSHQPHANGEFDIGVGIRCISPVDGSNFTKFLVGTYANGLSSIDLTAKTVTPVTFGHFGASLCPCRVISAYWCAHCQASCGVLLPHDQATRCIHAATMASCMRGMSPLTRWSAMLPKILALFHSCWNRRSGKQALRRTSRPIASPSTLQTVSPQSIWLDTGSHT